MEQVLKIDYDGLHGRFLHAKDNLDTLAAAVALGDSPTPASCASYQQVKTTPIISYGAMAATWSPLIFNPLLDRPPPGGHVTTGSARLSQSTNDRGQPQLEF